MNKFLLLLNIFFVMVGTIFFSFNNRNTNSIIGNVIFIDPGHGGNDNGTSYEGVLEDEINLKLAHILYEMILNEGAICYLTRTSDYDLSDMYSKNHKLEDLKKRVKMIDSAKTTLFISLHLNAYQSSKVEGIQVFYQNNEKSKSLAEILQTNLNKKNTNEKKCKIGDYYLLNNTKTTGVIVEYGFLSNPNDRKKVLKDSYLKEIATIIKQSMKEYLR